jgi:hypothetical protein
MNAKKEKDECSQSSSSSKGQNLGCYSSSSGYVRTSKSEDHLQLQKDSLSAVDIDINDDDTTSSLNNLLDTRMDAAESSSSITTVAQGKDNDRIVWTYNAPLSDLEHQQRLQALQQLQQQNSSDSNSISPNSPTSVSSSVMSSDNSSSKRVMLLNSMDGEVNNGGDYSEAISSPDFQVPFCLATFTPTTKGHTLNVACWLASSSFAFQPTHTYYLIMSMFPVLVMLLTFCHALINSMSA